MPGEVEFEEDLNSIQPLVLNRKEVIKSPMVRFLMGNGIRSKPLSYVILVLVSLCFFAAAFMMFSQAQPEAIPNYTEGLRGIPATIDR